VSATVLVWSESPKTGGHPRGATGHRGAERYPGIGFCFLDLHNYIPGIHTLPDIIPDIPDRPSYLTYLTYVPYLNIPGSPLLQTPPELHPTVPVYPKGQ